MFPRLDARRGVLFTLAVLVLACLPALTVHAEDREIAKRRAAERKTFTDAEIFDGFFKTAFGAELGLAGRVDRVRKYVVPVRVFIENRAKRDRSGDVRKVVDDIRARVANLDIAITEPPRGCQLHRSPGAGP